MACSCLKLKQKGINGTVLIFFIEASYLKTLYLLNIYLNTLFKIEAILIKLIFVNQFYNRQINT